MPTLTKQSRSRIVAAALLLAVGAMMPAFAQLDPAQSSVSATAKQLGVPIEGRFKKINATIHFEVTKLAQSAANIEIEVGSYDMGSPEYNKEVTGRDWFNAAQFPKATFVSSGIVAVSSAQYNVMGKFTLKGKTVEVTIPVTVKADAKTQVFDGALPIKRTLFHIGDGEWKDTSVVADDVVIKFHIVNRLLK
jgi:polyisoprenoid-binding protein YceI